MLRRTLIMSLLVAACGTSPSSPPPASAPKAADAPRPAAREPDAGAPSAHEPPPVLTARVATAMRAVALFQPELDGLQSFRPCVLVFEPTREWIFQCPGLAKSPGFDLTHAEVAGAPVFTAPTFTLPDQTEPFEKVKMLVGQAGGWVHLATASAGGERTPFFLMQDLDSLHAHHPAFVDTSAEDWTAIFVHEYFHVFQFGQPDVAAFANAWPKDWAQREAHAKFFKETPAYKEAITREVTILREGLAAPSKAGSRKVLATWIAARDRRMKTTAATFQKATGKSGYEETDGFFTFLEGTARYLEVRFLCDRSLARPDMSGDPAFKQFSAFEGCSATKVDGRDRVTGDFQYLIGMLLSAHLDNANPGWKKTVFTRPGFLIDEARAASK